MSQVRDGWSSTGSGGADQGTVRRANLSLVLRSLREDGGRSRARLAADLGLNKATVSSLVTELLERGLVREGSAERGAVGRPGTIVEIDGAGAYGVGAEINVHHVSTRAVDLAGTVVSEHRTSMDTRGLEPAEVVDRLGELLHATLDDLAALGAVPVSAVVGVAGLVDHDGGTVSVAANLGWQDVGLARLLRAALGDPDYLIKVDNEANLAAVAEATPGDPDRRDILVVHGEVGIGGGIVADGRPYAGRRGYAGEFGHMVVDRDGNRCGCGRTGCWETVIGLSHLIDLAASGDDDLLRSPVLDLEGKVEEIGRRAAAGDEQTLTALREIGHWVGIGAALLTNLLNPGMIVLSGYLGEIGEWFRAEAEAELAAGVLAPDAGGTRIALSALGFSAAVHGAAAVAIDHVYDDPTLVPRVVPTLEVMS
ncbi:ROK family transcriptional regulator [Nocardioides sp. zg-1228]|uniref:ROK family transcriptional regulator n=1 Tax=Nocardioides sp. zg-1228 TaxID=2763008 RepID=UPI001642AE2C|nr:ROK family transcriptional regulator [Nocardioides sp. zg-1228]MBC2933312.1 ROK family transcriptional regulator [Nocardioides sp. zg-1228]QSF56529.1 ROK family transcriptional regulator [Nocardioides sp. zg-1228]